MSEAKTKATDASVSGFLDGIKSEAKRADALKLLEMMREISGEEARMWGPSIVGFGSYHYKYESGREGDSLLIGFSPRAANLTLYVLTGFEGQEELLAKLGKHTTGKSCLYIKRLSDVDEATLRALISAAMEQQRKAHSA